MRWRGSVRLRSAAGTDERFNSFNLNPFGTACRDDRLATNESLLSSLDPLKLGMADRNQSQLGELGSNLLVAHADLLGDTMVSTPVS